MKRYAWRHGVKVIASTSTRRLAQRYGLPPELVHDRLNALAWSYRRSPSPLSGAHAPDASLERTATTGEPDTLFAVLAVHLEREARCRQSARQLSVKGAARRFMRRAPPQAHRPANWRKRALYRGLALLWRDATGKPPAVSVARPRGKAWRFLHDAVALLDKGGCGGLIRDGRIINRSAAALEFSFLVIGKASTRRQAAISSTDHKLTPEALLRRFTTY